MINFLDISAIVNMACFFIVDVVKVVNFQGKLKSSKRHATELHFDFTITAIGELGIYVRYDWKLINFFHT